MYIYTPPPLPLIIMLLWTVAPRLPPPDRVNYILGAYIGLTKGYQHSWSYSSAIITKISDYCPPSIYNVMIDIDPADRVNHV